MSETIYCGNARKVSGKFGEITKVSISKEDINKIVAYMKSNGLDWVNLDIKEKKNPSGKNTHSVSIDTWKPEKKDNNNGLPY